MPQQLVMSDLGSDGLGTKAKAHRVTAIGLNFKDFTPCALLISSIEIS